jgi:carbon storage regulator
MIGERIVITSPEGVHVSVMLVDIRGDKARLGFDAPEDWSVNREEVEVAIQRERDQ